MDEYGINNNYAGKLILGLIIGILLLFLVFPLVTNIIATEQVADAANSALNNVDTRVPSTASSVLPTATTPTENTTQANDTQVDKNTNNQDTQKVSTDGMTIIDGSISTGSSLSSKSVCKVYVGTQYSGANVKISTLYSRDGNNLNNGNIVDKTVESSGYITLKAKDSYDLYPDNCVVTIYDENGVMLDQKIVDLVTDSGTQYF